MKKILLVFGTRPEAIKMAPLVKEFQKYPTEFETQVCVTGQHRQMLDQVLEAFSITSDYDLAVMAQNQDLYDITSKVLLGMRDILRQSRPDIVCVHGDTTTSLAAAMASFYEHISVAHIEAGLRTYHMEAPWPEEMNRQLSDRLCTWCFAPTERAKENLLREHIAAEIEVTGNTVIDALLMAAAMFTANPALEQKVASEIREKGYRESGRKILLVTGHRRENFGEGFLNICRALKELATENPGMDIVYPVHLNPNVQKPVYELLSGIENVYLIPPLDYLPFVYMMRQSYVILTDSGGVQEEAPSLGKPVLVMRDTTERPEAIEAGTVKLVGTDKEKIIREVMILLQDGGTYTAMSRKNNPYGDGKASERIVDYLKNSLS